MKEKFLGVTPPISTSLPTAHELEITDKLVETLKEWDQFESEEEAQKRELVLGKLDSIFKDFVRKVSLKRNLPESIANEAGGKIFTFGSYRLGVHGKGSDIDTLCVAPRHVQREDFFSDMMEMLKATPEVTEVAAVSDAYVPVLKFEFSGIPIDLVCARLALPSVPDELDLYDDNLLKNLDERCVRSLNGSRVTDEILRLVPKVDSFRTALKCIKLWAKQRAIYSNVMGFFGGVAWAIVTARVCQLYPNAPSGVIVNKFFNIMLKWKWPQPVLLKQIEEGPLAVRVWNPRIYPQDKAHRMPVITPAYPSMCATHNVTASTNYVKIEEFKRGAEITEKIFIGTATWNDLFEKHDFFFRYKYYLQIIASSDSADRHLRWSGLVESRLRQLVMKLETVENLSVAHPYIKGIEKVTKCRTDQEGIDAAHGIYPTDDRTASTDIEGEEGEKADDEYIKTVYTTTFYIGLQIAPKDPGSNAPRKLDITWPTQEFMNLVKMWDSYDEATMGIVVQHIKSSQLPSELVQDRELQKQARKRSRTNKSNAERALKKPKPPEDMDLTESSEYLEKSSSQDLLGTHDSFAEELNAEEDDGTGQGIDSAVNADGPEHTAPPEIFYNEDEAVKYTENSRVISIQNQMTHRAIELLNLPQDQPAYILDIGCGSGLSGSVLDDEGHFYPEDNNQIELILSSCMRSGFTGGLVVDYPNSAKAKKYYLCLFAGYDGDQRASPSLPQGLTDESEGPAGVTFSSKRARDSRRKGKGKDKPKEKDRILHKKELNKLRGKANVPLDSKYTGRKRRIKF
ncbi:polynucleotide adenylyltransferase [Chytridiales sp. JEL 0842]|nr:polynucleotide adenylyltransferase [Chytridiales sp. JEL 0842]